MRRPPVPIFRLLLPTLLLWLLADVAECQSSDPSDPNEPSSPSDPGAAPWSAPGTIPGSSTNPAPRPSTRPRRPGVDERDAFGRRNADVARRLRCRLLEVEELGRIYVQETSGGDAYWIQLPPEVKIRTTDRDRFGGRKKLELEDLAAGQLLVLTMRRHDGEILRIQVLPAKPEKDR